MRVPGGYAVWQDPDGVVERDTFTCNHCNRICFVRPHPMGQGTTEELHGFCRLCMKPICGPCADLGSCMPFERRLEAEERRFRFARAAGLIDR